MKNETAFDFYMSIDFMGAYIQYMHIPNWRGVCMCVAKNIS